MTLEAKLWKVVMKCNGHVRKNNAGSLTFKNAIKTFLFCYHLKTISLTVL